MEKLDRFYVPNISEFHVGFEYEIHTTTTGGLSFLNFKEDGSTEMTEVSKPTHKIWEKTKVLNPIPTGERHIIKDEVIWDLEYDSFFYHRPLKDIGELINSNQVRVKYLDKEDIESLGFNQLSDDCFNLPIKEYRGRLNQEVRILIRQTVLIYLAMDMNYSDKDNLVLFTGNIKNKSELKKLMYQLNILKDEK